VAYLLGARRERLMRHRVRYGMVLALALLTAPILAGLAWAESIGPDCGSCFGGTYTLEFVGQDDGSVFIVYSANLPANMTDGATALTDIDAIAFKVVSGGQNNQITGGSLVGLLVDGTTVSPDWGTDFRVAGLSNGCDADNPPGDFVCSENVNGLNAGLELGHLYQWVFAIEYTGSLFTGPNEATIKADFSPGLGHQLSENIRLQPRPAVPTPFQVVPVSAPGTLIMFGSGLVSLGLIQRVVRRRRK
jgi:hypothetical protein